MKELPEIIVLIGAMPDVVRILEKDVIKFWLVSFPVKALHQNYLPSEYQIINILVVKSNELKKIKMHFKAQIWGQGQIQTQKWF